MKRVVILLVIMIGIMITATAQFSIAIPTHGYNEYSGSDEYISNATGGLRLAYDVSKQPDMDINIFFMYSAGNFIWENYSATRYGVTRFGVEMLHTFNDPKFYWGIGGGYLYLDSDIHSHLEAPFLYGKLGIKGKKGWFIDIGHERFVIGEYNHIKLRSLMITFGYKWGTKR